MQIGNTVLPSQPPRPNMMKFPTLDLASETLPAHNASLQSIMPGSGATPNGNFMPKIPVVNVPQSKIGAENFLPTLKTNHSVHETFGGSPRWEAEQMAHRPVNPRMFSAAPSVNVDFGPRHIPIRETPVLPKANMPNMPNLSGRVQKAEPMSLELRAVTPTLQMNDLGGLTSSMSKFGGIGQSSGRSFGSESFMNGF
jgi:hypothetical protein